MDLVQEINLPKETIYKNGLKKVIELTWKESAEDRFSSFQFSHSVMSDSLRPHELQQASLPVHHQLLEFTQTHVHRVSDAI